MTRSLAVILIVALALSAVLFVVPSSPAVAAGTWWDSLSQPEKNRSIIYRADYDAAGNRPVYLNCKEWVREVVRSASGGVVVIPPTLPNADGWYWADHPKCQRQWIGIRNAEHGMVCQLNWTQLNGVVTSHTFIVSCKDSNGFWVAESNWGSANKNPIRAAYRYITFTEFEQRVGSKYSIYRII